MDGGAEKKQQAKLAREISETLKKIDQTGTIPEDISNNPGIFLRELYEAWHHNGGLVGGRYRNSVRHMRKEWLTGPNLVRALHAKLVGRVKTAQQDAEHLVDLFLARWQFVGVSEADPSTTNDGYKPFQATDIKKLRRLLISTIFPRGSEESRSGIMLPSQAHHALEYGDKEVGSLVRQSGIYIVVSRHRIILGPTPPAAMWAMWHQLNDLYDQDKNSKDRIRKIIWVVDAGLSTVEDETSFHLYYNVGFLALIFRMFARFSASDDLHTSDQSSLVKRLWIGDRSERKSRWNWLNSVGIVAVQNLEREEFLDFYDEKENDLAELRLKDDAVTAEHILPSIVPQKWQKTLNRYYGVRYKKIDDATFTVFCQIENSKEARDQMIFYAHDQERGEPYIEGDLKWKTNSFKLENPGDIYERAYQMLSLAAEYRVSQSKKEVDNLDDTAISFAYIRKLGFQILKVEEFIKVF